MTQTEYIGAVERNNHRLFLIALSLLGNRTDAEDALQDVFLKLWRYAKPFENDEHTDKFLTRVCINVCKNMLRSPFRKRCTDLEDAQSLYTFDNTNDYDLFCAVWSLPVKERTVVHLFYYEDMPVREIAENLHMTESAVKTALHRARTRLKNCLKEEDTNE